MIMSTWQKYYVKQKQYSLEPTEAIHMSTSYKYYSTIEAIPIYVNHTVIDNSVQQSQLT